MKANSIREMSPEERGQKLVEMQEAFFNLRFQHETGQLENPQKMKQAKRDIARIQTIIREMEVNSNPTSES
ncbi:MAG: 50S ribosomal protein L29 [Desulfobacteraceae bacterium]|nr:50S ribosomal protein L29 [Desulfobacteraceae bacterium]MBC2748891.1 50S ribosomal protein L29 [Desulfobacteraceae bacterium]